MFGAPIRIGLSTVAGAVRGAVMSRGLGYMLPLMGDTNGLIYQSFAGISNHALLIMVLSGVLALFARATVESGGGYP